MSFESVVEHMQRELVAGATRRRRRERMHLGLAAIVVSIAVVVGAVALTRDDEQATRVSTEPSTDALTAARLEACNKFLDLQTNAPFPDPALALKEFAAAAATSRDATLAQLAAVYRDTYPIGEGQVSSEPFIESLNALVMRCRTIGTPGLNPVYVPAPSGPPPRVDLSAYGTVQELRPIGSKPPLGAARTEGRDLSPIEVAVSKEGGFVMRWTYNQGGPENPQVCRAYGAPQTGGSGCKRSDEPTSLPAPGLRIQSSGGNVGDPSAAIEVSDNTSFVVFEASGQQYVQQPVAGFTIFVWLDSGTSSRIDFTARAYDADGQLLGCVASGSSRC